MKKRLLAIIATLAMVVAMMPSMVFGATTVSNLTDLQNAINAGGEIALGADIDAGETCITVPAGVTVTIDLNGHDITGSKTQTVGHQLIENKGNLTIDDSVGGGVISYEDTGNGGEYQSSTIYNRGVLIVDNGTIENVSSTTVASNGYPEAITTYSGDRDTSVTINGGTIYCKEYSAIRMFCVSATNKADLVINGGTIKGAIDMQNGTKVAALGSLKINDGDFDTTKNANNIRFANWGNGFPDNEYGLTADIDGGNFDGGITSQYVPVAANWNKKVVSGGVFPENKVNDYISDDADKATVTNPDGTKRTAVGTETIKDIIESAPSGTNVTIDRAEDGTDYGKAAVGVTVVNGTAGDIKVDGKELAEGEKLTGVAVPAKPDNSPNTGDNSVAPFAVAGLALVAMVAAAVARRRYN